VDGLDLEDIFKEFGTVESAQARASAGRTPRCPRSTRSQRLSGGADRWALSVPARELQHSRALCAMSPPPFLRSALTLAPQVINDRETGRSRGFGFVVMATKEESAAAASELSGANIDGRKIIVEFASEKAKTE